ncbi:MAG: hypothetical protein IJ581_00945 [Paludibacteraceae bacterium]|nr:hypothetical protein [Paludibacteraceae bacterium]
MKKLFFTMAAIVTAMIISAQVAIDPAYSLQWEMNFVDYAINNLPGATNSSKSYVNADFTAQGAPKQGTKAGSKQFYTMTGIENVPADLYFWPNKECALFHYFTGAENARIGLRMTRDDEENENQILIDNLQVGDIVVLGVEKEPLLTSKTTCVKLQEKAQATSQDFVYGNRHRTFTYTEYAYTVTRAGAQAFMIAYASMLYDVKVYRK